MSSPLASKFICSSCCVSFDSAKDRNDHFKSDFHLFNLKRKAVLLQPISMNKYKEIKKDELKLQVEDCTYYCSLCKKRYNSENQIKEHEKTKKHKQNAKKYPDNAKNCIKKEKIHNEPEEEFDDDIPIQTIDEMIQERKDLAPKRSSKHCLFCDEESEDMMKNLEHMESVHSFFIPNIELCDDISGLLNYLHEKICIGYLCIWCSKQTSPFNSWQAVRQHMTDMCHCKMCYDEQTIEEYDDFYDYSEVPDPVEIISVDDSSMELANGKIIGHRSYSTFYKQSVKPVDTRACVLANQGSNRHVLPGAAPSPGVSKAVMAMPEKTYIDYVKSVLRKQLNDSKNKRDQQQIYRKWTKLGVKSNKLFKPCSQTNV
ncbi:Matrin-type domain-containing protein [Entamoeba marina]